LSSLNHSGITTVVPECDDLGQVVHTHGSVPKVVEFVTNRRMVMLINASAHHSADCWLWGGRGRGNRARLL